MRYTTLEQLQIFRNCKTASELLEYRTEIEALQPLCNTALFYYNTKMRVLLQTNKITA